MLRKTTYLDHGQAAAQTLFFYFTKSLPSFQQWFYLQPPSLNPKCTLSSLHVLVSLLLGLSPLATLNFLPLVFLESLFPLDTFPSSAGLIDHTLYRNKCENSRNFLANLSNQLTSFFSFHSVMFFKRYTNYLFSVVY